jgi:hypothetical protein
MNRNKSSPKAFTRKRFFCFQTSCVRVLQKTLKSIQLHIHSLAHLLERDAARSGKTVTAGAWTRAPAKLKHSAFIELNEEGLIKPFYEGSDIEVEVPRS